MVFKLRQSPVIWKLAKDLGIRTVTEPVSDILKFCDKKVIGFLREFPDCTTLPELLEVVANKVGTRFIEVRDEVDLEKVQAKFIRRGEKIFATLRNELSGNVFGITIKLLNRQQWEPEFVSVIDCRDDKAARSYFTKWHEIAHLLVLTDQLRLSFRRTQHKSPEQDPEEAMIDRIAGKFGFYESFIKKYAEGDVSFEGIEELRSELCAESSYLASLIGFVKAWPKPCLLLYCTPSLKTSEQNLLDQGSFDFVDKPTPSLRAVKITPSIPAIDANFRIHQNMRVPKASVICSVYDGDRAYAGAQENLSWWEASNGSCLPDCNIYVSAKRHGSGVFALVSPLN